MATPPSESFNGPEKYIVLPLAVVKQPLPLQRLSVSPSIGISSRWYLLLLCAVFQASLIPAHSMSQSCGFSSVHLYFSSSEIRLGDYFFVLNVQQQAIP